MNLDAIQHFIKEHLGLNAGTYGNDLWRELLVKRISTVGAHSPADYLARLRADETELHTLTSLITINETYFYRESQHLELLTEHLCPERLARRTSDTPVRLLSVGCSTGEEPYSILMALRERYGDLAERFFEVNAGDVDRAVLERARAGVYGRFSFRALSQSLQERYFTPIDANSFRIDECLRRQVRFQPFNLLAPEYPSNLAGQDVIFFRNVSIYFDAPTRQRVQEQLKTLLAPGGYLFVGISETLANDFGLLTLRERHGVFLFVNEPPAGTQAPITPGLLANHQAGREPGATRTPVTTTREPPPRPSRSGVRHTRRTDSAVRPSSPRTPAATPRPPRRDGPALLVPLDADALHDEALALAQSERVEAALERLAPLCDRAEPRPEDLVLKAHLLFEQDQITAAMALAQQVLDRDPWSLEALLLLGRGAQRQGRSAESIEYLRRAIYHQPESWPAHFQLAEVYRETGQAPLAQREYRIVLRQLERDASPVPPQVALIGAPALTLGDLQQLCQIRLDRLTTNL
ncbi:CheR family methyltransferase [Allochromatium palmeri]|uniref:Tetratricopeptide repeat protein n=1 Tax=Allochromatium palmeri TaxID=231048 RepID=A0A6N8E8Y3_9GAMM|nr:protein-glutamate O-methyltransferase CheR [Allochromatium palmeri]MTW19940.1 tetratricopeptide repeat protein [Allochromatium palmeri]